MKIMICGSMSFIQDILKAKKKLEKLGHEAFIPYGTEPHLNDLPHFERARWSHEVRIMQPLVLNGDLSKIK